MSSILTAGTIFITPKTTFGVFCFGYSMEIIDNKAVKLRVRNPDRITNVIPKSMHLGEVDPGIHEVAVYFGLEEMQVLRNLGIKNVPSPVSVNYEWPGIYKPFEHQRKTVEFLTLHRRCYLLNEPGTGKSGAVLWAADYLMQRGKAKRLLVICPVSIMRSAWVNDAFKTCMHRSIRVAHGTKEQRLAAINSDAEIVVINFDGVKVVQEELKGKFDLIAIDEATGIKNAQTDRWKAIAGLVRPDTWLWLMTGTPAAQSPLDAYGLAKLCTPSRVPSYFGAWRDKVMRKVSMFKWAPAPRATEIVHQALQPAIRFTRDECLDLPPILYQTRDVEMSKQQQKYYKALKKQLTITAAGESITAVHAAAALNKLLQLSLGAVYSDNGEVIRFDAKSRLDEMMAVISENEHKTIVFVPFRHAIEMVKEHCDNEGYPAEVICGDVPVSKRTSIFKRFQESDDLRVLVIQPQSAAHGVTLTAASTVVWFGPTSSVEIYLQGNARAYRAGQKNKTLIVRLCGSDVEQKVYAALDSKEADQHKLVSMYENILKG